jgi:hypothetical protein
MSALFTSKSRGRPRKQGVPRNENGAIAYGHRSDTENPDKVRAPAEEARVRQLLGVDAWTKARRNEKSLEAARKKVSNPLLGSALGRFLYANEIDRDQFEAGFWFAELYRDFAIIRGLPSPNMKALDYGAVAGRSTAPDKDEDWANGRKRKWERAMKAIYDANGDQGRTTGPIFEILKRTIVEDIGPHNAYELGNLRVGLNAINVARGA